MKKFLVLLLLVVAFLGYNGYKKRQERQREMLVGVWAIERNIEGASVRLLMNLKPDGNAVFAVDAHFRGRAGYVQNNGTWKVRNSNLVVVFDHTEIPSFKVGHEYGGRIQTLEDRKLSYKSTDRAELEEWTRSQ